MSTKRNARRIAGILSALVMLCCALFLPFFEVEASARALTDDDIWGYVITQDNMTMMQGRSADVSASVHTNADSYVIYWYSSNESVCKVQAIEWTDSATVYAMGEGTATITVSLRIQGMNVDSDSFTVRVEPSNTKVSGVVVNPDNITVAAGNTYQLQGYVYPNNASNKGLIWESWDTTVATVNSNGLVTGLRNGHTTIAARSAESGQLHDTCGVDVAGTLTPVSGISLSRSSMTLNAGSSAPLSYAIFPANANNKNVTWYSSNEMVAPVYQDGTVAGYHAGTAVITARTQDGGYTASCTVTVYGNSSITPSPSNPNVPTPVPASGTHDPTFIYNTCVAILGAPVNGTATAVCAKPLALDVNVANALKVRPDVQLLINFPFNGHSFNMLIPRGYNLTAKLDATGFVDFLVLTNYQNLPGEVQVVMVK